MKKTILILSLFAFISCKKNIEPTPVPTPTCNIGSETGVNNAYKLEYTYSADGLPGGLNVSVKDNVSGQLKPVATVRYTYENSRLVKVVDGEVEEKLEYNPNGILTRLTVVKTPEADYVNYTLNFETDANQRITKVTDSKGRQTTIKRDAQGNITETLTTDTRTNQELYRIVLGGYDNKKSLYDSFKGWSFSVLGYYADYIKFPLFTTAASGNATKRTDYEAGKALTEITYTYTYTTTDFPLTEQSFTKFLDGSGIATYSKTFTYTDCK
jgi:YD repeat-containing protein